MYENGQLDAGMLERIAPSPNWINVGTLAFDERHTVSGAEPESGVAERTDEAFEAVQLGYGLVPLVPYVGVVVLPDELLVCVPIVTLGLESCALAPKNPVW